MSYRSVRFLLVVFTLSMIASAAHAGEPDPLLVVLTDSGQMRDGLPVFLDHPQGKAIAAQLDRGEAGELIRVYRFVQRRLHRESGSEIEPAYLLLSNRQGGFAKYGFYRGSVKKAGVAYVDVHRRWDLSGSFGAIDQIFPHELAHAIFHELKIEAQPTDGSNQMHSIALRTDRFTAFDEGFAEHIQLMAVEHPGAVPSTRALANAQQKDARALRRLGEYTNEIEARIALAPRMKMTFPLWYSNDERVMRYFAVRRNAFAREPRIAERLLSTGDRYDAYLLAGTLPGDANGAIKPVAQMIASEGVVSSLFYRWATNSALQQRFREPAFYEQYGTSPDQLTPLQNLYLKIFFVLEQKRSRDVASFITAYKQTFPDEAPLVDSVTSAIFLGQSVAVPNQIWLADDDLETGTTLFDQFRGVPRSHTFDLNAASIVDLTSIRGVTPELARAIRERGPYQSIEDLGHVSGMTSALLSRFRTMNAGMRKLAAVDEEGLKLSSILLPYLWRFLAILFAVAAVAALVQWLIARRFGMTISTFRIILNGLGAALAGIAAAWWYGHAVVAIAVSLILFGVPAIAWELLRRKSGRNAGIAALRWAAAALPAAIVVTPWF